MKPPTLRIVCSGMCFSVMHSFDRRGRTDSSNGTSHVPRALRDVISSHRCS
jgi:hypothetical protein